MYMYSIMALLALAASTTAHTFLQCTHYDPSQEGQKQCDSDDNWPYHQKLVDQGKSMIYTHTSKSGNVCTGGDQGTQMLDLAKQAPKIKAGQTARLVWAANAHTDNQLTEAESKSANTGRFAYIWHLHDDDPSYDVMNTQPYAQFDWMNCHTRDYQSGRDFDIPNSADKDHFCTGNLTINEDLESGLHTFLFGWQWVAFDNPKAGDAGFDHLTCFQYQVENDANPSPTVKAKRAMADPTWSPIIAFTDGDAWKPMTGLQQTLEAKPMQIERDGGGSYSAFWRPGNNFLGAGANSIDAAGPTAASSAGKKGASKAKATARPTATGSTSNQSTHEGHNHAKRRLAFWH